MKYKIPLWSPSGCCGSKHSLWSCKDSVQIQSLGGKKIEICMSGLIFSSPFMSSTCFMEGFEERAFLCEMLRALQAGTLCHGPHRFLSPGAAVLNIPRGWFCAVSALERSDLSSYLSRSHGFFQSGKSSRVLCEMGNLTFDTQASISSLSFEFMFLHFFDFWHLADFCKWLWR